MGTSNVGVAGPLAPREEESQNIGTLVALYVGAQTTITNETLSQSFNPTNTQEAVTAHLKRFPHANLGDLCKGMETYETSAREISRARTVVSVASNLLAPYGLALEYVVSEEGIHLKGTLTIEGVATPLMFGTKERYKISDHNFGAFGDNTQISQEAAGAVVIAYEAIKYPSPSATGSPLRTGMGETLEQTGTRATSTIV